MQDIGDRESQTMRGGAHKEWERLMKTKPSQDGGTGLSREKRLRIMDGLRKFIVVDNPGSGECW